MSKKIPGTDYNKKHAEMLRKRREKLDRVEAAKAAEKGKRS